MSNLEVHKRVKSTVAHLHDLYGSTVFSLNVEIIAKNAGTDTRTCKKHLAILEENGWGFFCDNKKKTFRMGSRP